MRTRSFSLVASMLAGSLLVAACGGGGSITMKGGGSTTGSAMCRGFDDPRGPSDDLLATVPDRFAPSRAAISVFSDTAGADQSAAAFVDALSGEGLAENLRALAEFVRDECGPTAGGSQIAAIADVSEMVREPADDAYCAALAGSLADVEQPPSGDAFAAMRAAAPESHLAALDLLEEMVSASESFVPDDVESALGRLLGLGAYAEGACGIEDALAQFVIAGAFLGAGPEFGGGAAADAPTTTIDLGASAADPTAANAAAGAAGQSVLFGPFPIQLESDDPAFGVSAIVPAGWELDDTIGVEFSPPGDDIDTFFTSIGFDTGCDGLCAPTDWAERVRSDGGAVERFMASHPGATERSVAGSAGVVLVSASPDDPAALVVRWDDTASKYFVCTVDVDSGMVALLGPLTAACESSRPAWIAVG